MIAYVADPALVALARRQRIPLVDTAIAEGGARFFVSLDNDGVARLAAEHFLGLGLRHFSYCGVRDRVASDERRVRLAARLAAHGWELKAFAQSISEGEARMGPLVRWLRRLPRPVGILTFDDQLGERVLAGCQLAGLRVPDEVAVLGIGNDELICEVSWPSLSSITSPTSRIGLEAARMQRARSLFSGTARAVSAIALECGCATAASFSRAFRRRCGQWPTEFRKETRTT